MVATLTRYIGADNLDLAENAVNESMLKAMQSWPYKGVPKNPKAWLIKVAKNFAIDEIRKTKRHQEKNEQIAKGLTKESYTLSEEEFENKELMQDDRLKMLFLCCHPILQEKEQIAVALKLVFGLGIKEIAHAFVIPAKTLEQRILRAKKKLREVKAEFIFPEPQKTSERIKSVYRCLYLLFNEGHTASNSQELVTKDLCEDAISLLSIVLSHKYLNLPEGRALLSLFYFQASRLNERTGSNGDIKLLKDQDRSKWNNEYIKKGLIALNDSAEGNTLSVYHIEAHIASLHSTSPSFQDTNWKQIEELYELLYQLHPNPIYKLNRAVSILFSKGASDSLRELQKLESEKQLKGYYLYYCALAEAYLKSNDVDKAKDSFSRALQLAKTKPVISYIKSRIKELNI